MRTIQITLGEIIEAFYEELLETYGDKEVALMAAEAIAADLMAGRPNALQRPAIPANDGVPAAAPARRAA